MLWGNDKLTEVPNHPTAVLPGLSPVGNLLVFWNSQCVLVCPSGQTSWKEHWVALASSGSFPVTGSTQLRCTLPQLDRNSALSRVSPAHKRGSELGGFPGGSVSSYLLSPPLGCMLLEM